MHDNSTKCQFFFFGGGRTDDMAATAALDTSSSALNWICGNECAAEAQEAPPERLCILVIVRQILKTKARERMQEPRSSWGQDLPSHPLQSNHTA